MRGAFRSCTGIETLVPERIQIRAADPCPGLPQIGPVPDNRDCYVDPAVPALFSCSQTRLVDPPPTYTRTYSRTGYGKEPRPHHGEEVEHVVDRYLGREVS